MTDTQSTERSWRRIGCWSIVAVVALGLIAAAGLAGVAHLQIRDEARETRTTVQEVPGAPDREEAPPADPAEGDGGEPGSGPPSPVPGRIELDISVARLIVTPAETGESIRLDARYDPRYYELDQAEEEQPDGTWLYRVRFGPAHSSLMALFRMKLGADPPTVRLALPPDVPLRVSGEMDGSFAAMELGGLWLDDVDLEVDGGAVAVSLWEPLRQPMSSISLVGDRGSIKVVGLGNASPREAFFRQHLGELDLDLRGPWARDADVDVRAYLAGGTVWLPDETPVEGLEDRLFRPNPPTADEVPRPRLRMSVTEQGGRVVFID